MRFPPYLERVRMEPRGFTSPCWIWTGFITSNGYGRMGSTYAHRATYMQFVGLIPDGLELDHLCRVRECCNPYHLEPVTRKENLRRGVGAAVTRARHHAVDRCKHGHAFDAENTYLYRHGGLDRRACRTCKRERKRVYRAARASV